MSERNPFDDVGKPCGVAPTDFHKAAANARGNVAEAARKVQEAPLPVLPELVTGEAYDQLPLRSEALIHQDMLDDARFRDTIRDKLPELLTHQERVRAAKAISRRDPMMDDATAEFVADIATAEAAAEKKKERVIWCVWIWTAFCFVYSCAISQSILVAGFVALCMYCLAGGVIFLLGIVRTMGSSAGRAI